MSICEQKLYLFCGNTLLRTYLVSTSRAEPNCLKDSLGTPLGLHKIDGKIGAGENPETVFRGRKPDGLLGEQSPSEKKKNLILSRIMRLHGLEEGINAGGELDTFDRYVYIHGTNQADKIGVPNSHGCVLLAPKDMIELFDLAPDGSMVLISRD